MVLKDVVVLNPPKKRKGSSKRNPKGGSKVAGKRKSKNNAPAGKYWVPGYSRKGGVKVKGHYAKKPKKSNRGRSRRKQNPSRALAKPRTRTRTNTVVKYRYRNPQKPKVVYRYRNPPKRKNTRRRRRNPNGANGSPYKGPWTLKKAVSQVKMSEAIAAGAGLLAASLGPYALQRQFGWDLTSGHRDWMTSIGIALGGGMLVGRFSDPTSGKAFALAGIAVAAVKVLRAFSVGTVPSPLLGNQGLGYNGGMQPGGRLGNMANQALANATWQPRGQLGAGGYGGGYQRGYGQSGNKFYAVDEIHTHV